MNSQFLPVALDAIKRAEQVVMKNFDTGIAFVSKPDNTPVTEADKAAEAVIIKAIREAFPDHTFHGEESEKTDFTDHKGYTWIIDPIDGTRMYMRGIPLFGTLLALMRDGEIILGVSNMPAMGELIHAVKGEGAFLNDKPLRVSETAELSSAYVSVSRPRTFDKVGLYSKVLELDNQVELLRGLPDLWMYHLVAQGRMDVMMEATTKLWDIAPFKVIIEEAGGKFTQLDGRPITAASTSSLATNGHLHSAVLGLMS